MEAGENLMGGGENDGEKNEKEEVVVSVFEVKNVQSPEKVWKLSMPEKRKLNFSPEEETNLKKQCDLDRSFSDLETFNDNVVDGNIVRESNMLDPHIEGGNLMSPKKDNEENGEIKNYWFKNERSNEYLKKGVWWRRSPEYGLSQYIEAIQEIIGMNQILATGFPELSRGEAYIRTDELAQELANRGITIDGHYIKIYLQYRKPQSVIIFNVKLWISDEEIRKSFEKIGIIGPNDIMTLNAQVDKEKCGNIPSIHKEITLYRFPRSNLPRNIEIESRGDRWTFDLATGSTICYNCQGWGHRAMYCELPIRKKTWAEKIRPRERIENTEENENETEKQETKNGQNESRGQRIGYVPDPVVFPALPVLQNSNVKNDACLEEGKENDKVLEETIIIENQQLNNIDKMVEEVDKSETTIGGVDGMDNKNGEKMEVVIQEDKDEKSEQSDVSIEEISSEKKKGENSEQRSTRTRRMERLRKIDEKKDDNELIYPKEAIDMANFIVTVMLMKTNVIAEAKRFIKMYSLDEGYRIYFEYIDIYEKMGNSDLIYKFLEKIKKNSDIQVRKDGEGRSKSGNISGRGGRNKK